GRQRGHTPADPAISKTSNRAKGLPPMTTKRITRRTALKHMAAAGAAAPLVYRAYSHAAPPSETLNHASFGAGGMAGSDIGSLTPRKHVRPVPRPHLHPQPTPPLPH